MADLLAMVVDSQAWLELLSKSADDLHHDLSNNSARKSRPAQADFLDRRFDIDVEADILDWMEEESISGVDSTLETASKKMSDGADIEEIATGIWLLAEWASRGTWQSLEGRGFLYLEPYSGGAMRGVGQLYEEATWEAVSATLKGITAPEFSEAVVLDWMARREGFGETMEAEEDPRILSTMQSHQRLATALHGVAEMLDEEGLILLTRREWSSFLAAGFGGFNIGSLLSSGVEGVD